jgi:regulatory protein
VASNTEHNVLWPDVPAWKPPSKEGTGEPEAPWRRRFPRQDEYQSAMERAYRILSSRARFENEVRDRLLKADFDSDTVETVLLRLNEMGLLDDAAVARDWIGDRLARKKPSSRSLIEGLCTRGVDRELAAAAVADSGLVEVEQATEVAAGLVGKLANRPSAEQGPRLFERLIRRGFTYEAAEEAVKAVLPPEGWD